MIFSRQQDLVDMPALQELKITVIGAGAVGSCTVLALAKMGATKITVFDGDKVEPHNLPNQFYRTEDLNKHKVSALKEIVQAFTEVEIDAVSQMYDKQPLEGVVISAVDSMHARKDIWEAMKTNFKVPLYIDSRMGAEVAEIHAVHPILHGRKYEEYLWDDSQASEEPCTRKAISYTALGMSSWLSGHVKRFVQKEPIPQLLRVDFKLCKCIDC